jgi:hypothetical protein
MSDDKPSLHDIAMQKAKSQSTTPEQQHEEDVRKLQREITNKFLKNVGVFAKREAQRLEKANIPKLELQYSWDAGRPENFVDTFLGQNGQKKDDEYEPVYSVHGWHIAYISSDGEVHKWLRCQDGGLTNFLTDDGRLMFVTPGVIGDHMRVVVGTLHCIPGYSNYIIKGGVDISTFDQGQAYSAFECADDSSHQWVWGTGSGHVQFYDNPNVIIRGWEAAVADTLQGNPLIGECEICDAELIQRRDLKAQQDYDRAIRRACHQFYRWAKAHNIQPNVGRLTGSVFRRTVDIGWLLDRHSSTSTSDPYGPNSYSSYTHSWGLIVSIKGEIIKGSSVSNDHYRDAKGEKQGYSYFKDYQPIQDDSLIGNAFSIEGVNSEIALFASKEDIPPPKFAE